MADSHDTEVTEVVVPMPMPTEGAGEGNLGSASLTHSESASFPPWHVTIQRNVSSHSLVFGWSHSWIIEVKISGSVFIVQRKFADFGELLDDLAQELPRLVSDLPILPDSSSNDKNFGANHISTLESLLREMLEHDSFGSSQSLHLWLRPKYADFVLFNENRELYSGWLYKKGSSKDKGGKSKTKGKGMLGMPRKLMKNPLKAGLGIGEWQKRWFVLRKHYPALLSLAYYHSKPSDTDDSAGYASGVVYFGPGTIFRNPNSDDDCDKQHGIVFMNPLTQEAISSSSFQLTSMSDRLCGEERGKLVLSADSEALKSRWWKMVRSAMRSTTKSAKPGTGMALKGVMWGFMPAIRAEVARFNAQVNAKAKANAAIVRPTAVDIEFVEQDIDIDAAAASAGDKKKGKKYKYKSKRARSASDSGSDTDTDTPVQKRESQIELETRAVEAATIAQYLADDEWPNTNTSSYAPHEFLTFSERVRREIVLGLLKSRDFVNPDQRPIDYVLHFPTDPNMYTDTSTGMSGASVSQHKIGLELEKRYIRDLFLSILQEYGLVLAESPSHDKDEIFIKIFAPLSVLCREAEYVKLRKSVHVSTIASGGNEVKEEEGKGEDGGEAEADIQGYVLPYTLDAHLKFVKFDDPINFFTPAERSMLVQSLVSRIRFFVPSKLHHAAPSRANTSSHKLSSCLSFSSISSKAKERKMRERERVALFDKMLRGEQGSSAGADGDADVIELQSMESPKMKPKVSLSLSHGPEHRSRMHTYSASDADADGEGEHFSDGDGDGDDDENAETHELVQVQDRVEVQVQVRNDGENGNSNSNANGSEGGDDTDEEDDREKHSIYSLLSSGIFSGFYPLHTLEKEGQSQSQSNVTRNWLLKYWLKKPLSYAPLDYISQYFGSKIALYFAWCEFYTLLLVFPSLFGVITFIVGLTSGKGSLDSPLTIPFAIIMAIWSTVYLELWKRRNSELSFRWNTTYYEEEEIIRPDFYGEVKRSEITGEEELYYPKWKRKVKYLLGSLGIMTMIMLVIVSSVGILFYRLISTQLHSDLHKILAGVANALSIMILNNVYSTLAQKLTDWENHETESDYEDAFIAKSFLFQFINSNITLVYIAFFKSHATFWTYFGAMSGDSCHPECLTELSTQLGALLLTKMSVDNVKEVLMPYIKAKFGLWREMRNNDGSTPLTQWEVESKLPDAPPVREEYAELVIMYGYSILFVVAFPLAPLIVLVNNLIEMRTDGAKLLFSFKRSPALLAQDIGTWYTFLNVTSFLAVISNVLMICFTSTQLDFSSGSGSVNEYRFLLFILLEHGILILKFLLAEIIPDQPAWVVTALKRQKYLERRDELEEKHQIQIQSSDENQPQPSVWDPDESQVSTRLHARLANLHSDDIAALLPRANREMVDISADS